MTISRFWMPPSGPPAVLRYDKKSTTNPAIVAQKPRRESCEWIIDNFDE